MSDYSDDQGYEDNYVRESERQGIRPGFLASMGALAAAGKEKKPGEQKSAGGDDKRKDAAKELQGAENAAKDKKNAPKDGVAGAAANERNAGGSPRGLYTGKGKPNVGKGAGGKNSKAKSTLKKFGPMGVIAAVITAVGGLLVGAQAMMPVAISELLIEKLNSIGISSTAASDSWLNAQLNYGVTQLYVATQEKANLFRFSDDQKKEFEKQGIKVIDDVGGTEITKITALLYKKNGVWIPVVGSDMLQYNGYTEEGLMNAIRAASGISNIGEPVGVTTAMQDEKEFKIPYMTASKTWRGGVSGWFDTLMSNVTEIKLNVTRNRWLSFAAKSLGKASEQFKSIAKSAALEKTSAGSMTGREEVSRGDETDVEVVPDPEAITEGMDAANIERILNSKAMKAAKAAAGAIDVSCSIVNGLITIYTLVSAYQNLQFLNLVSGFLEAVDKVKAGRGDESPVNDYSTNLVTVGDTIDRNTDEVVARKTAMESAGMAQLFTPTATINTKDVSVQNVNIESIMSNIGAFMGDIKTMTQISTACRTASVGTAAFGLATSVLSVIPLFGQGVKLTEVLIKVLGRAAIQAAAMAVVSLIIPVATKAIVQMVVKNAATEWFGEDLGNALMSGANKYLGGNGSAGAQSPMSKPKLIQYAGVRDAVIAEEAKYQRAIRDPLDITSRYTFLGSLVYTMMPLAYSGGAMNVLSSLSSLMGSSLLSLTPAANAVNEENLFNSVGDCDILESVGGVGDAYCVAYIATDVSTILRDPIISFRNAYYADGEYEYWFKVYLPGGGWYWDSRIVGYTPQKDGEDNIVWPSLSTWDATNGKMTLHGPGGDGQEGYNYISKAFNAEGTNVLKDSNLAKYIVYCGERTSQYGIQDGTIADRMSKNGGIVGTIMNITPGLDDFNALARALEDKANDKFISGQVCVANSEYNEEWEGEYKYYQRYVENERLLENMSSTYTSPVSKTFAQYHAKNPIDTSFEGTLARFSGMTVEQVDTALALLEYYEYVADYDPSERFAFGTSVVEMEDAIFFESDTKVAVQYFILTNEIIYADVRNRVNLV